jgi:prefoldin subunit 5
MEMLMSTEIDPIETARELATHANDIEHLQADMDKMVDEMKQIKEAVQAIQKTLAEAHGGWRVLIGVGGAMALVGGAIGWVVEKFMK